MRIGAALHTPIVPACQRENPDAAPTVSRFSKRLYRTAEAEYRIFGECPSDAGASDKGDGQDGAECQRAEDCPCGANSAANVLRRSIGQSCWSASTSGAYTLLPDPSELHRAANRARVAQRRESNPRLNRNALTNSSLLIAKANLISGRRSIISIGTRSAPKVGRYAPSDLPC